MSIEGILLRQQLPIETAAMILSGEAIGMADLPCYQRYHLLGFGPSQITKGSGPWKHHLPCQPQLSVAEFKTWASIWNEAHPKFVEWIDNLRHRARKERFVRNPYGRSMLNGNQQQWQAFMVLSTAFDALKKAVVDADVQLVDIAFGQIRVASMAERDRLLAIDWDFSWE